MFDHETAATVTWTARVPADVTYPSSRPLEKAWSDESIKAQGGQRFQLLSRRDALDAVARFGDHSVRVSAGISYLKESESGGTVLLREGAVAFEYNGPAPNSIRFIQFYYPELYEGAVRLESRFSEIEFDGESRGYGVHPSYEKGQTYARYMDDPLPLVNVFNDELGRRSAPVVLTLRITLTVWAVFDDVIRGCLTVTFPSSVDSRDAGTDGTIPIRKLPLENVTANIQDSDAFVRFLNQSIPGMEYLRDAFRDNGAHAALGLTGLND